MKKTLMITGASGFIGSNFIERYKEEYNIIPVDLIKEKPEDLNYKGVDCILHLAALVHQMKGAPREKYFEVNTELTRRIAESAKKSGVKHFIFYSTVKVYGYDGDLYNHDFILTENSPCNPNEPYGESKYEAEKILKILELEGFKVAIVRPPMVYGKGVKGNMLSLIKLVKLSPILPFNFDKNKRTIVGVDNLLYMTKLIIDKNADGIYLGSDGEAVSIKKIVEIISLALNKKIINVKFPSLIFNLLYKVREKEVVRLYGTLNFSQEDKYKKIGYIPQKAMSVEIKLMVDIKSKKGEVKCLI